MCDRGRPLLGHQSPANVEGMTLGAASKPTPATSSRAASLLTVALGMGVGALSACSGSSDSDIPAGASSSTSSSSGSSSGGASSSSSASSSSGGSSGDASVEDASSDAGGRGCAVGVAGECQAGQYCLANNSGDGCQKGTCVPIPSNETSARTPACGCDGVTYWNATVAAHHGVSVRKPGACTADVAAKCGGLGPAACPNASFCNQKTTKAGCGIVDGNGVCWQIPAICPPAVPITSRACVGLTCADECTLIRKQQTWYEDTCP